MGLGGSSLHASGESSGSHIAVLFVGSILCVIGLEISVRIFVRWCFVLVVSGSLSVAW